MPFLELGNVQATTATDPELARRRLHFELRKCFEYGCAFPYHHWALWAGFETNAQVAGGDRWNKQGLEIWRTELSNLDNKGLFAGFQFCEKPIRINSRIEYSVKIDHLDESVGNYSLEEVSVPSKGFVYKLNYRKEGIICYFRYLVKTNRASQIAEGLFITPVITTKELHDFSSLFYPKNVEPLVAGQPTVETCRELHQCGSLISLPQPKGTCYLLTEKILSNYTFGGKVIFEPEPKGVIPFSVPQKIHTPQEQSKGRDGNLQAQVRSDLLARHPFCAITECGIPILLEAAHVYPHKEGGDDSTRIGNMLLLSRNVHRLFDNGKISICPRTYEVHVSEDVADRPLRSGVPCSTLQGKVAEVEHVDQSSLEYHWRKFQEQKEKV